MMNERMLELYRQAQVPHTAIDPSNNMPYQTTCFSAEKFAKLIVQECSSVCRTVGDAVWSEKLQSNLGTARTCEAAIKEHFGVKS